MIRREFGGAISILDANKLSQEKDMHEDNVHLVPDYYEQLAVILSEFFRGSSSNTTAE